MDAIVQEIRFAIRSLRKHPGYTFIAVLTIALGIGANSAIFNVVNAAMIRPLPYVSPNQLVHVGETSSRQPYPGQVSYGDYEQLRRENRSLEGVAGYGFFPGVLNSESGSEQMPGVRVTASFFPLLGVNPALGRTFTEAEEAASSGPVVLLTDELWRGRFGANPAIVGQAIRMNSELFTVIGVLPANFSFAKTPMAKFFVPLRAQDFEKQRRFFHWMYAFGRLQAGVSVQQAQSDLDRVSRQFAVTDPQWHKTTGLGVVRLQRDVVGVFQPILLMLMAAVAFVLLIACANVANLMLARTSARQREIATRTALGASRWDIARLLLVESLVVALVGAALGVAWSYWCSEVLIGFIPEQVKQAAPFLSSSHIDLSVALFAALLAVVAGVLFGALPALQFSRGDIGTALKQASRTSAGGRSVVYDSLIVAEVALALMLLVGAGLLSLSLNRLMHADPGFETHGIYTTRVMVPPSMREDADVRNFQRELMSKVSALPGVEGVATTDVVPLTGQGGTGSPQVVGRPAPQGRDYQVDVREVSADYFKVMRIPMVSGRMFEQRDTEQSTPAVIVNRQLASELFPDGNPLGQHIKFSFTGDMQWEVVGVVGNESARTLDTPNVPVFYFHYGADRGLNLVIRTAASTGLGENVRSIVNSLDPNAPVSELLSMQQIIENSPVTFVHRYPAILLSGFGLLSLILALVGIYGVVAYSVAQRTREIGIRIALGARSMQVLDAVLRRNAFLTGTGLFVGLICTLLLGRFMQGFLFGVQATDARVLSASVIALGCISLLASYIPARRATLVDPMISLREE
ncbi:MAG TPA: ABC transporter permease [Terriglobales bacterium]|nr:ABC transporter permease [Terriglobales bacterium]